MSREELVEDLAYVKALAEEGRHAPLLGGAFLMFWGALNATAYVLQWAILAGYISEYDGAAYAVLWTSYGVAAGLGMALLGHRFRSKPGFAAIGNRVHAAAWAGAGIGVGMIAIGCIVRMLMEHDPSAPNNIMGPAFALFGAAMSATARVSGQTWLNWFAGLSFIAAVATLMFANEPWAYLAAAGFSLIVLLGPGLLLARGEPSTTV